MVDNIRSLSFKKLLSELDYTESDFEYRLALFTEADSEFIKCVNIFLENHPDIKDLYDEKINTKVNDIIVDKISNVINESSDFEIENNDIIDISPKIKKLYREIVKKTHPDLVSDIRLNDIYIESTICYNNNNDKVGIYKLCSLLNITYDIDEDDEASVSSKIDDIKSKIIFLESNLTWKWYKSENKSEKDKILFEYIKSRLL